MPRKAAAAQVVEPTAPEAPSQPVKRARKAPASKAPEATPVTPEAAQFDGLTAKAVADALAVEPAKPRRAKRKASTTPKAGPVTVTQAEPKREAVTTIDPASAAAGVQCDKCHRTFRAGDSAAIGPGGYLVHPSFMVCKPAWQGVA